jgi:maleylacetate reductase
MNAICQAFEAAGRAADSAAGAVWDLATEIGAPTNLIQVGYDPARIEETAEIVSSATIVNPREVTKTGVEQLLRAAVEGARP